MTCHVTPTRADASSVIATLTVNSIGADSQVNWPLVDGSSPTISQPVANGVTSCKTVPNIGWNATRMSRRTVGCVAVAYPGPTNRSAPTSRKWSSRRLTSARQTVKSNAASGTKASQYVTARESAR